MSPDPSGWNAVDQTTPQSLNRYAYVENQPMSLVDPSGLTYFVCVSGEQNSGCAYVPDDVWQGAVGNGQGGGGNYVVGNTIYQCDSSGNNCVAVGSITYVPDGSSPPQNPSQPNGPAPGGGGGGSGAPSNATPWYKSCTAQALGSGALSIGVDALGFIPGEKDVQAAVEIGSGTVARQIGNWNGYRGIVADQFGARFIAGQSQNVSAAASGYSIGNGVGTGDWLGTGLAVAGLIPGLNELAAGASIVYDGYKTAKAAANCH